MQAPCALPAKSTALTTYPVKTIAEIRLLNLEALIKRLGTLEKVAAAAGSSAIYLSQIRHKAKSSKNGRPREMGTDMARRIEAGAGLEVGWMDVDHSGASYPAAAALPTVHTVQEPHAGYSENAVEAAVMALAKHLTAAPERTRKVALSILQGLVESPHDAPEIAAEVAELLSAAKRRAA